MLNKWVNIPIVKLDWFIDVWTGQLYRFMTTKKKAFRSKQSSNKKVLLRERKRHTARRVVSTLSVVLPGYPPPPRGGYLTQVPPQGGYLTRVPPRGGYLTRVPPGGVTWPRYPPRGGTRSGGVPDLGTPPRLMAFWEMLQSIMGYGYPPLWTDRLMDGQTRVKTLPSLVLRTRAVISRPETAYID